MFIRVHPWFSLALEVIMCDTLNEKPAAGVKTIPVEEAIGTVLAHDITEIRKEEFKGRAFRKGHVVTKEDVCHLQRLGKERLFVLTIAEDEMHEDVAACTLAAALMGEGVAMEGEPKEGKINIVAARHGLLKIDKNTLFEFNMVDDVMCATLHNNTVVTKGQVVAGTRAIPLVVKKAVVGEAVKIAKGPRGQGVKGSGEEGDLSLEPSKPRSLESFSKGVIEVREMRRPRAGVVITGNEVYHGRIKDAFAPVIRKKIEEVGGELVGIYYAPDDEAYIEERLRELIEAGADLLITTGGMSVDPDDVTRFAIRRLGATDITYGSAALPGAMFLVGYVSAEVQKNGSAEVKSCAEIRESETSVLPNFRASEPIPILGIPACGMYHKTTVFDLILPRVLAGERIGRRELAELGHGGLCLNCKECRYPVCPFGKGK